MLNLRIIAASENCCQVQFTRDISLIVEPRKKIEWSDFSKNYPSYSIALDGYVIGSTQRDPIRAIANFNHHEQVDRLSTSATCLQVLHELDTGLFERFKLNGRPHINLYVEDCDEDVSLSIALFYLYLSAPNLYYNYRLHRLVDIENRLDKTGGMYPIGDLDQLTYGNIRWVYESYRNIRKNNLIATIDSLGMYKIISDIVERVVLLAQDRAEEIPLEGKYEILAESKVKKGCLVIAESGYDSRTKLISDGVISFFSGSEVRLADGDIRWKYTVAKTSTWIPIDLFALYNYLNQLEGISLESKDRWGGSNLIGGSPKEMHSKLSPQEIIKVFDDFIAAFEN